MLRNSSRRLMSTRLATSTNLSTLGFTSQIHFAPQAQLEKLRERSDNPNLDVDSEGNTLLHRLTASKASVKAIDEEMRKVGPEAASTMSLMVNNKGKLPIDHVSGDDESRPLVFNMMCDYKVKRLSVSVSKVHVLSPYPVRSPELGENLQTAWELMREVRDKIRLSCTHPESNFFPLEKQKAIQEKIAYNRQFLSRYDFSDKDLYEQVAKLALKTGYGDCREMAAATMLKYKEKYPQRSGALMLVQNADHLVFALGTDKEGNIIDGTVIADPASGTAYCAGERDKKLTGYRQVPPTTSSKHTFNFFTSYNRECHGLVSIHPKKVVQDDQEQIQTNSFSLFAQQNNGNHSRNGETEQSTLQMSSRSSRINV